MQLLQRTEPTLGDTQSSVTLAPGAPDTSGLCKHLYLHAYTMPCPHTHSHTLRIKNSIYTYVHIYIYAHTCIHIHIRVHIYVCICIYIYSQIWWHILIIPARGRRWRQVNSRGFLTSQPSWIGELQTNERPCLKEEHGVLKGGTQDWPLVSTWTWTHMHMHLHTHVNFHNTCIKGGILLHY